MTETD